MDHVLKLKKLGYDKTNPINDLTDIKNIKFFVVTYSKTGTMSLSHMLAKSENYKTFRNVVHCHSECCWFKLFPNISRDFDIMKLIKQQNHKPIVFQLMRNPVDRIISEYKHLERKENMNCNINDFINQRCHVTPYYENKFGYKISELSYDKTNKYCLIDKGDYFIYFTALEHFSHLKRNLKKLFNIDISLLKQNQAPKSQKNPEITKEQAKLIFDRFNLLVNFYYTNIEIEEMKAKYNL